jgi:hypothetical protein
MRAAQRPITIAVRNSGNLFDPVVRYALGLADAQGNLEHVVRVHREVHVGEVITRLCSEHALETWSLHLPDVSARRGVLRKRAANEAQEDETAARHFRS